MELRKPPGLSFANLGKNAKKKTLNKSPTVTFPTLIIAYFIGFFSARIFENGIIARASSVKIQIVYVMYSTLMSDQVESVFRNNNEITKNTIEDQKSVIIEVEITFFLLSSEL